MRVKEHPELDYSPSLNEKDQKDYQHIIGICKWLIVTGRYELAHAIIHWVGSRVDLG